MKKKMLDIAELKKAAKDFCEKESGLYRPELFGVTDGKAIGTFVEHLFQEFLERQYENGHRKFCKRFGFTFCKYRYQGNFYQPTAVKLSI